VFSSDAPRATRGFHRFNSQQALITHDHASGLSSPMTFYDQRVHKQRKEKVRKERATLKDLNSKNRDTSSLTSKKQNKIKADLSLVEMTEPAIPIIPTITNTASLKDGIRNTDEYDALIRWNDFATKTYLDLKFEKKKRREERYSRVNADRASSSLDETDPNVIKLQNTIKYKDPRANRKSKHPTVQVFPQDINVELNIKNLLSDNEVKKNRIKKEKEVQRRSERKSRRRRAKNIYGIPEGFDSESNLEYAVGAKAPIDWNGYNDIPPLPSESTKCTDDNRSKKFSKKSVQIIKSCCSSDSSYMIVKVKKKTSKRIVAANHRKVAV